MGKETELKYFNFLKGKNIVIVGPAGYLENEEKGKEIDSFDIVIRLNQAIPINNSKSRGTKTNVLYHTLFSKPLIYKDQKYIKNKDLINGNDVSIWKNQGVKWVVTYEHGLWRKRIRLVKKYLDKMFWITIPSSFCSIIRNDMGTIPNTGVYAILHVLCAEIKSLYVLGFDFHATGAYYCNDIGTFSSMMEMSEQWHDTKMQIDFLYDLWKNENRLSVDYVLEKILLEGGRK